MAPMSSGSVKLDREQRRDLKVLISRLGLKQKDIALGIGMDTATLSSAIREEGDRAFKDVQFAALHGLIAAKHAEASTGQIVEVRDELRRLFESVFATEGVGAAALEVGPGEPMAIGATCYVARHHDILTRMASKPKPLRFVVGAPMTGKTAALLRLQFEAQRMGRNVEYLDFSLEAQKQRVDKTPVENPTAHLLEIVYRVLVGDPNGYQARSISKGVESRIFTNALRDALLRKYRGREVLIILDHVHMFSDDPRFWGAVREFPLAIANVNAVNVHLVVADDGTCIETAFQSATYAKASPILFGSFDEDCIELLVRQVVNSELELDSGRAHDARRLLGDIAVLHHLAVGWAFEAMKPGPRNSAVGLFTVEYLDKCNEIVDLLTSLDPKSPEVQINERHKLLVTFRRRVLNSILRPRLEDNLDARTVLHKLASANNGGQILAGLGLPNSYVIPITWAGLAQLSREIPAYFSAIAQWGHDNYEKIAASGGSL
jgi:hypothetical protein